jgi:hypothetical protein
MPSLRSVLPASTLVDFFKRLIVFLAILLSSFRLAPLGRCHHICKLLAICRQQSTVH